MSRAEKRHNKELAEKDAKDTRSTKARLLTLAEQERTLENQHALSLAVQHHKAGDLPKAKSIYKQILQADPNQPVVLHFLGLIARQVGESDRAVKLIGDALKIKPDYAEAHSNLGSVFQELGEVDEAMASYSRAITIKPDYAEAHYNLGNALQELGQLEEALSSYSKALNVRPDYVEAHNNLGLTLQALGELDKAVTSYNKAISIDPALVEAYSNLGNALKELGKLNEAMASYNKAIAIKPDLVEAYSNLGTVLQAVGKLDEAVASYKKALAIKPNYAEAHNNLGNAFQELGKLDDAVSSYNEAISIKPGYTEAHNNLGNALSSLGKFDEAIVSYNKVIELKPDFSSARYYLGIALFELGNHKKATVQFRASSFGKSQSYLLRCLYLQREQSLFYEQLDYLITKGEVNALTGSLGCRAAIKYGEEKPNLFCKDPIAYVISADLKEQYDFENTFIKATNTILNENKVLYRKQSLLINGHQTFGNLFDIESNFMDKIRSVIHSEIAKYRLRFKNSKEGFIRNWPTDYSLNGWLINMNSGGELKPHMHINGWISGSIYINVPPKSKAESGNLVVCIDGEEPLINGNQSYKKIINVVTGSLCLFPASLLHYTIPFASEEKRTVLAFDLIPK
jgi:tetratricopeptide (TPR) repeat protein